MLIKDFIPGDLFYATGYYSGWYLVLEHCYYGRKDLYLRQNKTIEVRYPRPFFNRKVAPSNSVYRQGRLIFGPGVKGLQDSGNKK